MRRLVCATALAFALGVGGCFGSGGGGKKAAPTPAEAANAFIKCFQKPGYQAVEPKQGQESLFAAQVKSHGYDVAPANVTKPNAVAASAYLVFFKDDAAAKKAKDEVEVTNSSDASPLERGQVIVGYLDEDSKTDLEPAIIGCL